MYKIPKSAWQIIHALSDAGFEACAVGGCVRDSILGKTPSDWDIATSATPEQVMQALPKVKTLPTGIEHGTVTAVLDDMNIEITTYRIDGAYSDGRHPDAVSFTPSLIEDLKRRDFTINAMAIMQDGSLFDPLGGACDLKDRVIRAVGNPTLRFSEDALRIMRAVRFCSQLGFDIEQQTAQAAIEGRHLLERVSAERIQKELSLLLCGANVRKVMLNYRLILAQIIPEIKPMFDFDQRNKHHIYDVWEHSAHVTSVIAPELELRLAAMLHDLAKPQTMSIDEQGSGHFFGHALLSAQMAYPILKRLKYSNKITKIVVQLIEYHDHRFTPSEKVLLRWLNRLDFEGLQLLLELKIADNFAKNPKYTQRSEDAKEGLLMLKYLKKRSDLCYKIGQLKIDGTDLSKLGFSGKGIGEGLEKLLFAVIEGKIANEKKALLDYAQMLMKV